MYNLSIIVIVTWKNINQSFNFKLLSVQSSLRVKIEKEKKTHTYIKISKLISKVYAKRNAFSFEVKDIRIKELRTLEIERKLSYFSSTVR